MVTALPPSHNPPASRRQCGILPRANRVFPISVSTRADPGNSRDLRAGIRKPRDAKLRCGDRRRRRDGIVRRLPPARRAGLSRARARGRAGPDLPALGLGSVGRFDPAAVLDGREHPHLPVRHRFPARHRRASRGRRRAAGDRPQGGRISVCRAVRPGPRSWRRTGPCRRRRGPISRFSTRPASRSASRGCARTTSLAGRSGARARAGSTAGACCRPCAARRARSGRSTAPAR